VRAARYYSVAGPDRTDRPPVGVVRPAGGLPPAIVSSTRAHGGNDLLRSAEPDLGRYQIRSVSTRPTLGLPEPTWGN